MLKFVNNAYNQVIVWFDSVVACTLTEGFSFFQREEITINDSECSRTGSVSHSSKYTRPGSVLS